MTDQAKDFSPETVLSAVATELRYNRDDLEVEWDETVEPRRHYEVRGKSNKMSLAVYRTGADAEAAVRTLIQDSLIARTFFNYDFPDRSVLAEVSKVCTLADLTPYLTMAAREGWAMPTGDENEQGVSDPAIGNAKTIVEIKVNQAALLAEWLKSPVAAVWRLQGGDLPSVLAVLIEQCSYDVDALLRALMSGRGGWRPYLSGCVAVTPEGFVISALNLAAEEYLEELYDAIQSETPPSS